MASSKAARSPSEVMLRSRVAIVRIPLSPARRHVAREGMVATREVMTESRKRVDGIQSRCTVKCRAGGVCSPAKIAHTTLGNRDAATW